MNLLDFLRMARAALYNPLSYAVNLSDLSLEETHPVEHIVLEIGERSDGPLHLLNQMLV